MKPCLKSHLKILFLLMAVCHFTASCTKKLLPGVSESKAGINDSLNLTCMPDGSETMTSDKYSGIERQSIQKLQNLKDSSIPMTAGSNPVADRIIATAMGYLGVPHCMGGTTTRCLDCSGMVMIVFEDFGINLPHNAQEQSKHGRIIKEKKDLEKGDIVFFKGSYKTNKYITHSGIYIGDNRFIHTSVGKGVTVTSLDDSWWRGKYVFATRVLD